MVFVYAEEETMANKECYTELSRAEDYESLLFERKMDFETKNSTIEEANIPNLYEQLNSEYKKYVMCLIDDLCDGNDNIGYNVKQVVDTFRQYQVSQNSVAVVISESLPSFSGTEIDIVKRLGKIKGQSTITTNTKTTNTKKSGKTTKNILKAFCENYLISMELLQKGHGKIFVLNRKYKDNIQDVAEECPKLKEGTTLLNVLKSCEKVMKQKNIITGANESLLIEKYAVMTKNGQYLGLNKEQKKAVNHLIENLHSYQQKNSEFFYH